MLPEGRTLQHPDMWDIIERCHAASGALRRARRFEEARAALREAEEIVGRDPADPTSELGCAQPQVLHEAANVTRDQYAAGGLQFCAHPRPVERKQWATGRAYYLLTERPTRAAQEATLRGMRKLVKSGLVITIFEAVTELHPHLDAVPLADLHQVLADAFVVTDKGSHQFRRRRAVDSGDQTCCG